MLRHLSTTLRKFHSLTLIPLSYLLFHEKQIILSYRDSSRSLINNKMRSVLPLTFVITGCFLFIYFHFFQCLMKDHTLSQNFRLTVVCLTSVLFGKWKILHFAMYFPRTFWYNPFVVNTNLSPFYHLFVMPTYFDFTVPNPTQPDHTRFPIII